VVDQLTQVREMIERFIAAARLELQQRWDNWPMDLDKNEVHEVVGALLARQTTLATQIARSPDTWNGHIAPIILRSMADVYITLAWSLKDPVQRSRDFILYGLGQAKLDIEYRRAQKSDVRTEAANKRIIEASENWINEQRFTFLTEVNLGSWTGKNTRELAVEAECLDFYNYVYVPFSAVTHSMWHHIGKYNLKECSNPLHRFHHVPEDPDMPLDPHYLYLAGKYLQKTFKLFDTTIGVSISAASAYESLCEDFDKFSTPPEEPPSSGQVRQQDSG
jgi:hypothetical protein